MDLAGPDIIAPEDMEATTRELLDKGALDDEAEDNAAKKGDAAKEGDVTEEDTTGKKKMTPPKRTTPPGKMLPRKPTPQRKTTTRAKASRLPKNSTARIKEDPEKKAMSVVVQFCYLLFILYKYFFV